MNNVESISRVSLYIYRRNRNKGRNIKSALFRTRMALREYRLVTEEKKYSVFQIKLAEIYLFISYIFTFLVYSTLFLFVRLCVLCALRRKKEKKILLISYSYHKIFVVVLQHAHVAISWNNVFHATLSLRRETARNAPTTFTLAYLGP